MSRVGFQGSALLRMEHLGVDKERILEALDSESLNRYIEKGLTPGEFAEDVANGNIHNFWSK